MLSATGVRLHKFKRCSARQKTEVVLRLLRGEALDLLSRELGIPAARLATWRASAACGVWPAPLSTGSGGHPLRRVPDGAPWAPAWMTPWWTTSGVSWRRCPSQAKGTVRSRPGCGMRGIRTSPRRVLRLLRAHHHRIDLRCEGLATRGGTGKLIATLLAPFFGFPAAKPFFMSCSPWHWGQIPVIILPHKHRYICVVGRKSSSVSASMRKRYHYLVDTLILPISRSRRCTAWPRRRSSRFSRRYPRAR
jgi:hypothetical protein